MTSHEDDDEDQNDDDNDANEEVRTAKILRCVQRAFFSCCFSFHTSLNQTHN